MVFFLLEILQYFLSILTFAENEVLPYQKLQIVKGTLT